MDNHQLNQIKIINDIEKQVSDNVLNFSTVAPVIDYIDDPRICLTSVHFPKKNLMVEIQKLISSLKEVEPSYFYYPNDSLHMTIKGIRTINDPLHFNQNDIGKAEKVFSKVVPKHRKFNVYFYRLLLFPNNLALVGTTDPNLDSIHLDLDKELRENGVPDDKKYNNSQYFFSNMTLARFSKASNNFRQKVVELSESMKFEPYVVDSVTLLTCNAVLKKKKIVSSWKLK